MKTKTALDRKATEGINLLCFSSPRRVAETALKPAVFGITIDMIPFSRLNVKRLNGIFIVFVQKSEYLSDYAFFGITFTPGPIVLVTEMLFTY